MKLQGTYNMTMSFDGVDTNMDGSWQKAEFDQANNASDVNGG